ncbi:hypothetical protein FB567DRAFT_600226 [Paraphoma chrysanthemicola]|uniref:CorA-like transporter domain-containing protein n=1 Tax=Paraphoma chrysanthemicola TaxID=798071 RepID=A0A8K0W3T9_9PLEO|nr:hypothetical protein FB567DRAFT_600226 [Paraphoma chrysanthemicola]
MCHCEEPPFLFSQTFIHQTLNLSSTECFRRMPSCKQNSVTEEFCERSIGSIFEKEQNGSIIEVRVHSGFDFSRYSIEEKASQISSAGEVTRQSEPPEVVDVDAKHDHSSIDTNPPRMINHESSRMSTKTVVNPFNKSDNDTAQTFVLALDPAKLTPFISETQSLFRVLCAKSLIRSELSILILTSYIRQRNSYSRLQITKDEYLTLTRECNALPQLTNYLVNFEFKTRETEVGPPRITFRPEFYRGMSADCFIGFECVYMMRFIEFTNRPKRPPWSLRQYAVYHKWNTSTTAPRFTWMLFGASQRTEPCINTYLEEVHDTKQAHPFELHVIFLDTAISSWRPYLIYLHDKVVDLADKAFITPVGKQGSLKDHYVVDVNDYQSLKTIEDRASDALICLDSTLDTVKTLQEMHGRYLLGFRTTREPDDPSTNRLYTPHDDIMFALQEQENEVLYSRVKIEALLSKAQNTRALISALLERINGHNIEQQMLALQHLEREAQEENASMRQLTEKGHRDSASVRILTIITLIYLPCTVVSSFYSTQFVDQETSDQGMTMKYADNAWLFFAVSIPLTLGTIMVWYAWANWLVIWRVLVARREKGRERLRKRLEGIKVFGRGADLPR